MYQAGVPILAGTDCLNPYCLPGFSLHGELHLLVQAGLTPLDALRCATINAARFIERQDQMGSLTEGKDADVVILNGNPLEDIEHTREIHAVVLQGALLDRVTLEDRLEAFRVDSN